MYRLSLYHCYLREMLMGGDSGRITSTRLAQDLDITEETVRRDMTFIGTVGRPGAGYDLRELYDQIQGFLGLEEDYPIIRVGTAEMLRSLMVVFPPQAYGVTPVAYYSELPQDIGEDLHGVTVQHISAIPELDSALNVKVALVACSQGYVQLVVDLLVKAGIEGILVLTPALRIERPEGVNITHIRMPCDIKSLACRCQLPKLDERAG